MFIYLCEKQKLSGYTKNAVSFKGAEAVAGTGIS